MKQAVLLIILFTLPTIALAQTNTNDMLQNIANDLKKLDEKVDKKFERLDTRLDKIELDLARYDERFISINSKITFMGSIAGFVAMLIMAAFGFLYNKIYTLNKDVALIKSAINEQTYFQTLIEEKNNILREMQEKIYEIEKKKAETDKGDTDKEDYYTTIMKKDEVAFVEPPNYEKLLAKFLASEFNKQPDISEEEIQQRLKEFISHSKKQKNKK